MNVHQVLSSGGRHDAVTRQALSFRARFTRWGWGGHDHAAVIGPGMNGRLRPLRRLRAGRGDVLLLHHSAAAPRFRRLLALPCPKLLVYHNVTPAEWLWQHAPAVALPCALGREQLPELVRAVDVAVGVSAFNASELRALGAVRTEVIPLLVELERLGPPESDAGGGDGPTVLFVGRLSPHKRQDEVIKAFALYRRHRAPAARLVLVGDPVSQEYGQLLRSLAEELAPGAVTIESGLSDAELGERYRAADAFLCLSAHEGFCAPLLEAFHFGLPVIARPAGAVPETAGDAALLVDDPDLAVVAELLHLVVSDRELRAELQRRGRAQLERYAPARVEQRLRATVEDLLAGAGPAPGRH